MNPEMLTAIATVLAAAVAVPAAIFTVHEYRRSGRWRQAEVAATHLRRLSCDDVLGFACEVLDWGVGRIVVPSSLRCLANGDYIEHDARMVCIALSPRLNTETLDDPRGLLYRRCLDRLFGFLDEAQELLDLKLVEPIHLAGLRYWLAHLADWPYAPGNDGRRVFVPFLVEAGYGRVLRLFESLRVPLEYSDEPLQKRAKEVMERSIFPTGPRR